MYSTTLQNKIFSILLFLFMANSSLAQTKKIAKYKKWKSINKVLSEVKTEGVLLLRVKNYSKGKMYIEKNYDKKTYQQYCDQIDLFNKIAQEDIRGGFTFSKVYTFSSEYSKNILNNDLESILFRDPENGDTIKLNSDTPHLFADIYDFKHNTNTTPLELNTQKEIRILNEKLSPDLLLNLNQNIAYHPNEDVIGNCKHIYSGASSLSKKFDKKLEWSEVYIENLEKAIRLKQEEDNQKANDSIKELNEVKANTTSKKTIAKIDKRITKLQNLITQSEKLLIELFEK